MLRSPQNWPRSPLGASSSRFFLAELDRLSRARVSFSFETTLSGLSHLARLKRWKAAGYRIEVLFLRLSSPTPVSLKAGLQLATVEIAGLDIYDPIRDEVKSRDVHDIAYWMLDDDYVRV